MQAYRPLAQGNGVGSLLRDETLKSIGRAHGKTSAQVALRWVLQLGHSLTTTTENVRHMSSDLQVFDFELSVEEMGLLTVWILCRTSRRSCAITLHLSL